MSIGHKPLTREWDLIPCGSSNRNSNLKDDFLSPGAVLEIAYQIAYQESFSFVVLLTLALALWLVSQKQRSDTRQTEGDREKDTDGQQLKTKIPPGNSGWPLIGETIEFVIDGRKFFRSRRAKYGSVFRSHLCGLPTVVVVGAENVQKVLTAPESSLIQSPPSSFLKLFGRGALSSTVGRRHSQLQRSVIKLFTPRNLLQFVTPVQKVIRGHVARWRSAEAEVVNGADACREMALSVVYQCLLGFDLDERETSRITELFQTFSDGVFAFPVNLPGFAFHKAMVARTELRRLVSQRSNSSSSSSFTDGRHRNQLSMLDILQSMSAGDSADEKSDDDDGVADLVLELLFGANESTASAMCTTLVELSEDQSVLDKIRCELRKLGVGSGDLVDYETLRHLTYTSDVVKEVLRVQPPIAGAFRRTCKPFHIQDYVIPAGWTVLYGITDTHEASSAFDDVQKFNPDRWKNVRLGRTSLESDNKEVTSQKDLESDDVNDKMTAQTSEQTKAHRPTSELTTVQTSEQIIAHMKEQTKAHSSEQTKAHSSEQMKARPSEQTSEHTSEQTTARSVSRYEYIPFGGGGKRFCVGEALARMVLSVFLVEIANGTNGWKLVNGRPEMKTAPIPFPKDHLPLVFNSEHGLRHDDEA